MESDLIRKVSGLSQSQVIENLVSLLHLDYFKDYVLKDGKISSKVFEISSIGDSWLKKSRFSTLDSLADAVSGVLNSIPKKESTLYVAAFKIWMPEKEQISLYGEESVNRLGTPLAIIGRDEKDRSGYSFIVWQDGFWGSFASIKKDESYLEKIRQNWYDKVIGNLNKVLPYKIK